MFDVRYHQEQNCFIQLNKETNVSLTLKKIEGLFIYSPVMSHLGEYFKDFSLYRGCNIIIIRDISMTFRSLKAEVCSLILTHKCLHNLVSK